MARNPLKPIDLERQLPALPGGGRRSNCRPGLAGTNPTDPAMSPWCSFCCSALARPPAGRPPRRQFQRPHRWPVGAGRRPRPRRRTRNDLAFAVLVKPGTAGPWRRRRSRRTTGWRPAARSSPIWCDRQAGAGGRRLTALPEMARPYLRAEAAALATVKASAGQLKLPDRLRPQYRRLLELGFKDGPLPVIAAMSPHRQRRRPQPGQRGFWSISPIFASSRPPARSCATSPP